MPPTATPSLPYGNSGTTTVDTVTSSTSPSPRPMYYSPTSPPSYYGTVYSSNIWEGPCEIFQGSRTLWYTLVLPQRTCVHARLTGSDASILIFSGECGDFSCVGTSSRANGAQEIVWEVEASIVYYVVVKGSHGYYHDGEPGSEFTLEMQTVPCVDNDSCSAATQIIALPFVDVTSNEMVSQQQSTNSFAQACNQFQWDSRGLWYEMVGRGSCVR